MATQYVDSNGVLRRISLDGDTSLTLLPSVREIAPFVFTEDITITSLVLNDECETIRNKAFFFNRTIRELRIGNRLSNIETYAVAGTNPIEKITGDSSVYKSSDTGNLYDSTKTKVVLGTNKTRVEFEEGTTSIGERAFSFCDKITNLGLPDTLTEVGDFAFSDCAGFPKQYSGAAGQLHSASL